jgi:hypothetical protein
MIPDLSLRKRLTAILLLITIPVVLADSIKDSSPDSALVFYHKAILMLQPSSKEKDNLDHLSKAYYGLAYINSPNGEYKAALQNDSIAMSLARRQLPVNLFRKPVKHSKMGIYLY